MPGEAQVVVTPALPISRFDRIWPAAALAAATIVNVTWMVLISYGLFKLVELAFS
jgi:hypothetical protein